MEASIAIALIAGISGVIGTCVTGYISLKTNQRIDELQDQVEESKKQIVILQDESCHQKKLILKLKKYLRDWWEGIQSLLTQIGKLGHEPVWHPEAPPELEDDDE